ncbi:hypothetical protein [Leifsonia sp. 22587]|uniref:hypothetical protein n=1 Tax=Leifsonia sp. 22587 TaxID=3453946 RepID=UPI003F861B57
MAEWFTFAVVSGGIGAALLGLLFVAVSIRIDVIAASAELRSRAAQTLGLFLVPVLVGLALSLPGQSALWAGVELAVVALLVASALEVLDRRAGDRRQERLSRALGIGAPRTVTCVVLLVGAVLTMAGLQLGLYLVALAVAIAVLGGIVSAWLFLTHVPG